MKERACVSVRERKERYEEKSIGDREKGGRERESYREKENNREK